MPLSNTFFYHETYRKCMVAFSDLFSNIEVIRYNADQTENSRVRVPLTFVPKERYWFATQQNPDFNNPTLATFPRMTAEATDVEYDSERMHFPNNRLISGTVSAGTLANTWQPVPYNLRVKLFVFSITIGEGLQIIEQILPFFESDVTVLIDVLSSPSIKLDIPIVLEGIDQQDYWDGQFQERRQTMWSLDFLIKTYFFGPVRTSNRIETVDINTYDIDGLNQYFNVNWNAQEVLTVTEYGSTYVAPAPAQFVYETGVYELGVYV